MVEYQPICLLIRLETSQIRQTSAAKGRRRKSPSRRVVKFATGQQSSIGGADRVAKLQGRAAVKIEPGRTRRHSVPIVLPGLPTDNRLRRPLYPGSEPEDLLPDFVIYFLMRRSIGIANSRAASLYQSVDLKSADRVSIFRLLPFGLTARDLCDFAAMPFDATRFTT